jgi:hypothetical protein
MDKPNKSMNLAKPRQNLYIKGKNLSKLYEKKIKLCEDDDQEMAKKYWTYKLRNLKGSLPNLNKYPRKKRKIKNKPNRWMDEPVSARFISGGAPGSKR